MEDCWFYFHRAGAKKIIVSNNVTITIFIAFSAHQHNTSVSESRSQLLLSVCEFVCVCACVCMRAYVCHTSFSQRVQEVAKYIQQQNHEIYEQRGLILGDPMDRGLRCVSYCMVNYGRRSFSLLQVLIQLLKWEINKRAVQHSDYPILFLLWIQPVSYLASKCIL